MFDDTNENNFSTFFEQIGDVVERGIRVQWQMHSDYGPEMREQTQNEETNARTKDV